MARAGTRLRESAQPTAPTCRFCGSDRTQTGLILKAHTSNYTIQG